MKSVAIFTEGQSELIFVRTFIQKIVNANGFNLECLKLHSDSLQSVPYSLKSPNAKISFRIINVQNDGRVLSAIRDREKSLFEHGYEKIIGLRDMYCEFYDKKTHGRISELISKQIIDANINEVNKMSNPNKISMFYSIMELEAWFLSMYSIFPKIDDFLSIEYIEKKLGYNLRDIDPQKEFYRPSIILSEIFKLRGLKYDKSVNSIEKIMAKMNNDDFEIALADGRCRSFSDFYNEIKLFNIN